MQIFVKHQIYKTMKKLQSNFTTPEQSKRLLELGVPKKSADCFYPLTLLGNVLGGTPTIITFELDTDEIEWDKVNAIPCWSAGRLIEIYHICDSPGCSFTFHVCFPNLMNEIMYKLAEASRNGWLNLSKLEK